MENLDKIRWVIVIEDGQLLGIYENSQCVSDTHFVLDNSDTSLTEREFEEIVTHVVDNFVDSGYFSFVDIFR